jgi:AcrR family transcriptional regulator
MWAGVNIKRMKSRDAYHHGDLRNALVGAAARLAAGGGPAAVTVRAAARDVGVTPTAAYRHFANHEALLDAAKHECTRRMAEAMRKRLDATPAERDPVRSAVLRLEAIGRGYVDFAIAEPGLFRTAFCLGEMEGKAEVLTGHKPAGEDVGVDEPHAMLLDLIDQLVRLGFFTEEQRLGAVVSAWSLVHGLAMLLIEGPLAGVPDDARTAVIDEALASYSRAFWNAGHH